MNILILNWRDVTHPKSGGAEIVTMEHAKGWEKKGHTVTWLTSYYNGAKSEEMIEGVKIVRRSGSLLIYPYGFFYVFFKGSEYDVIIDEIHALAFCAPLATRTPVVAFIHEVAGEIWNYMASFPLNIIGRLFEKVYFPFYRNVLFWTDAPSTIDELVTYGIVREHCTAIPCPITKSVSKIQEKKEEHPTFLFVSRVVPMKGIEEVLDAFSLITKEQHDARLWIVGGGDEEYIRNLNTMIEHLQIKNNVQFWGKVSEREKFRLMSKAHLLLHASVKEGWGLVVLEAAAMGTPSIVYNVPGLRDVVKNRSTGVVLSNNLPQEMAKQALLLLEDKKRYKQFQKNGKQWVKSLKWEDVIDQSFALLTKAVQRVAS